LDLKPIPALPTEEERAAVCSVLGDAALGGEASPDDAGEGQPLPLASASSRRHLLLPALHALQSRVGWVSPGGLGLVARRLSIAPAEAFGVASFYALLSTDPAPPAVAHVCDDVACGLAGAEQLLVDVAARLAGRDDARVTRTACLGQCDRAPAALVQLAGPRPTSRSILAASADAIIEALSSPAGPGAPAPASPASVVPSGNTHGALAPAPGLRMLRRVGRVDPTSLDAYRASGGYEALRQALAAGQASVLREIDEAGVRGRGGAAFPAGKKWAAVARQPATLRYVVCNADESEPTTFKDRALLEGDPFAVVEGMTLAAFATGAEKGFIYLRAEYPLAAERLASAIAQARARGLLGDDVMGQGVRFELELRIGAGAYICGEETALLRSIEGLRGEPANKPPFPVEVGLFGKPTSINNVETLVACLDVITLGAREFRAVGTAGSPGTKLFSVCGRVQSPGVFEVPFGTTLGALIELAGGELARVSCVLLGGAAGAFASRDDLSLPLTFEDARQAGLTLGSGAAFVLGEGDDVPALLVRIAAFFRHESCGQCVPCRVGTVRQEELVQRLVRGAPHGSVADELALLGDLGQAMRDASICGLGQTATSALESAATRLHVFSPRGGS
jgi:NADH-quinone oxidoreductase subunit F